MINELDNLSREKQNQIDKVIKDQLDQCFDKMNRILDDIFAKLQMSMKETLSTFIQKTRLAAIQEYITNKANLTATKELTPEVIALLNKLKNCHTKKDYKPLPECYAQYIELIYQSQTNKKKENSIARLKNIIEIDYETINSAFKTLHGQVIQLQKKIVKEIPKRGLVFNHSANKELNEYYPTFPPTRPKPYVYYWKADSLYVYFMEQKKVVYGLDYLTEYSFGCCMWKNKIYFSGGGKNEEYYSRTMECEVKESSASAHVLADMQKPKCSHTLVAFNGTHVFSLGGFIERRDNNYCEVYSVEKNQWMPIKPLNEPKAYVIACTFRNRFIYCIGGRGCTSVNSVEIYDGLAPEDGWVSREIAERIDSLTKNNYGEAIQSSCNSLIILSRSTLFDYNVMTNKLQKRGDVSAEDLGLEIVPLMYKSWIYQIAKRSPKPYIEAFSTIQKKTATIDIDQ